MDAAKMTEDQKSKCRAIIHGHAAGCAVGNCVPVPGVGFAVDMVAMTTMAMSLAAVFGGSLPHEVAKGLAVATIKRTALKQPLRTIAKELSKLVPVLGLTVSPAISVAMVEASGWSTAKQLAREAGYGNE
jgi:uncharacterized protein (DUF697 family)